MRRLSAIFIMMFMTFVLLPEVVHADTVASGISGGCTWTLDNNGKLIVAPTPGENGILKDWSSSYSPPWYSVHEQIKSVQFQNVKAQTCKYMFRDCPNLTTIDLSGLDTSDVEDMYQMFLNCESLEAIDLSNTVTSSVKDMSGMFEGCKALKTLNLSGVVTSSVTYMGGMFSGCEALETLDLSDFYTSSVTVMSGMFEGCEALKTLDLSGFNTSSVTAMDSMFEGCEALKTLDLSGFDTSSVKEMKSMFEYCMNLQKIIVSDLWQTDNVTDGGGTMFEGCYKLVGCNGTTYDESYTDIEYARVDLPDAPGYLTHIYYDVPHTITVTMEGNGIAYSSLGSATMGTEITLTAYPDTGWHFKEWEVASGGVSIDENNIFTMGIKDVEIKAVFESCVNYLEETKEVSATCTEDGTAAYWTCKTCGEMYSDKGCTTVITKPVVILKTGHDLVKTDEVKATCTKDGTEAYWTCSKCKKMFSDQGGNTEIAKPAAIPKTGHNIVKVDEVKATCIKDGSEAYWTCSKCKKMFSDQNGKTEIAKPKAISAAGHVWGEWTLSKEATYDTEGEEKRVCKNDASHVETKPVAKKVKNDETEKPDPPKPDPDPPKPNPDPPKPDPDVPLTPETEINEADAPAAKAQEKKILKLKSDSDPKGSVYGALQARMKKASKNSITLKWKKIKGAKYTVYGNKCGKKNKYKKLKTVKGTSFTQKKLEEGTYYKYLVVAVKNGKAIATSKTIHAATTGGKAGNNKSVKVIKKTVSVAIGKTVRISASATKANKKLKVKNHRKIAFESSNTYIATVTNKGVVKGIRSGTCYVYAYAQNGVMAKVTVKVS